MANRSSNRHARGRRVFLTRRAKQSLQRRIALYYVIGHDVSRIAKMCEIVPSTARRYLQEEATQRFIARFETETYDAAEKRFKHLLVEAVNRTRKIVKKGSDDAALKAIEMIYKIDGRLQTGSQRMAAEMEAFLSGGGMVGAVAMKPNPEQLQGVMEYLAATREPKALPKT